MKIFHHKSKKINVSPIKTVRRWIIWTNLYNYLRFGSIIIVQ